MQKRFITSGPDKQVDKTPLASDRNSHLLFYSYITGWIMDGTNDWEQYFLKDFYSYIQAFSLRVHNKKIIFSYFSIKTYVVGTQKNRLNKKVLLSSQNIW